VQSRSRAVSATAVVTCLLLSAAVSPVLAAPARWEVTIAVRLTGGGATPATVRMALPYEAPGQRLLEVDVAERGLVPTIVREGDQPHVSFTGRFKNARRLAVAFVVEIADQDDLVPPIWPAGAPNAALLPFVSPTPLFQSRSILVREFLDSHAAPLLARGTVDPMRAIYEVTRRALPRSASGKSLALDVIRRRQGKGIGIERAFTTFLRCARIPARFVEGVRLTSKTQRKRVFWTEVWGEDRWWPVSASEGWIGNRPSSDLGLARDGTRVVSVSGPATASYTVRARRLRRPS
jgi:hypothetical protein